MLASSNNSAGDRCCVRPCRDLCWQVFSTIVASARAPLPPPRFHHLELNTRDPDAAIAFYVKQFPVTSKTSWEGKPALSSPDNVLIVFNRVAAAPTRSQCHRLLAFRLEREGSRARAWSSGGRRDILVPFYTHEQGSFVGIGSDTYPYLAGCARRYPSAALAEARAQNLQPRREAGNGYIAGPDGAIIEFTGNAPAELVDHVQHSARRSGLRPTLVPDASECHAAPPARGVQPVSPPASGPTAVDYRQARSPEPSGRPDQGGHLSRPPAGYASAMSAMNWYPNQTGKPLAPTTGRLMDHIGLGVADLDAWVAKLRGEGVTFLRQPYRVGTTRAVLIEGPSRKLHRTPGSEMGQKPVLARYRLMLLCNKASAGEFMRHPLFVTVCPDRRGLFRGLRPDNAAGHGDLHTPPAAPAPARPPRAARPCCASPCPCRACPSLISG